MKKKDIDKSDIGEYYWRYIDLVEEEDLVTALEKCGERFSFFLSNIEEDLWDFSYQPGKWTIKDMIQHIIDTERIFQYRALSFARGESTLPGFDHDEYTKSSNAGRRSKADLISEFQNVRASSISLYQSLNYEMLKSLGTMNAVNATPGAIGFILSGHPLHHQKILKERYLDAD